jgi:Gram-negative bacterial TonB protein C-terminal
MNSLRKTCIIASFAITLILITSNEVLSQSKTQIDKDQKLKADTIFFDLSNTEGLFIEFEQPPQFPGGDRALINYIVQNTYYPHTAVDDSITGKVFTLFAINIDGSIDDVQVIRGVRSDIDIECIRVIKEMPTWKPGEVMKKAQKGYYWTKFRMFYSIPITFTLDTLSIHNGFIITPKHHRK